MQAVAIGVSFILFILTKLPIYSKAMNYLASKNIFTHMDIPARKICDELVIENLKTTS